MEKGSFYTEINDDVVCSQEVVDGERKFLQGDQ